MLCATSDHNHSIRDAQELKGHDKLSGVADQRGKAEEVGLRTRLRRDYCSLRIFYDILGARSRCQSLDGLSEASNQMQPMFCRRSRKATISNH
mgnify:CR=1 FL=1